VVADVIPRIRTVISERPTGSAATVFTVGHSNHPFDRLVVLLRSHDLDLVVDVRSRPYSCFAPQFNREALMASLPNEGIAYIFLGRELGGRPDGERYYDEDGHVLYGRVADSRLFHEGIAQLEEGMGRYRLALMCSEEDPTECHRRLLVTRVLSDRGAKVLHLRGDGRVQHEADLAGNAQGDIFNGFEEAAWRSTRSVSPRRAPLTSSAS
jgi:uncharacterized protein (DUF488 family)